jgi:hypothetical protein
MDPVPETEAVQPKNFFSRLGGVYLSPKSTFQEIGRRPAVWLPIIAIIVIGSLMGIYIARTMDFHSAAVAMLERQVQQGNMTEEIMEQRLPGVATFIKGSTLMATIFGGVAFVLIIAGFAKLFSTFVRAQNRFRALFSVTAFSMIAISIIQTGLTILILYVKGTADLNLQNMNSVVASNLGAVLEGIVGNDVLPKFVMGLARAVDVFAIWIIALLSIGYSAVSRKLKTSTAAVWLAVPYVIFVILSAMIRPPSMP